MVNGVLEAITKNKSKQPGWSLKFDKQHNAVKELFFALPYSALPACGVRMPRNNFLSSAAEQ